MIKLTSYKTFAGDVHRPYSFCVNPQRIELITPLDDEDPCHEVELRQGYHSLVEIVGRKPYLVCETADEIVRAIHVTK